MSDFKPLTFLEQSLLLDRLVSRTAMHDGAPADTVMVLDNEDAKALVHLSMRLARLAPYQDRIERLVMGGK
ncbi:hypothetical protein HF263_02870 [Rhizobium leguminosarum]|jgi:hypothetical protein|uniref:hypothetical protein n=1 Tax=Rhizobium leguminosarum TaxID=384 RepID=UPI001C908700|nr:hypothetical protein [Rhizobium leguminosarum]MBY3055021.1 hypothetical protein [Rhizobium leguminosarum]